MAGGFKFQKGPIYLSDDEAHVDSVDANAKLSKSHTFTTFLHSFSIYISTAGIGSLIWAYVVVRGIDRSRPPLYEDFMENFVAVIFLLLVSIVWSIFNMWLLRHRRITLPRTCNLIYNISMMFCLIYFPSVCCYRLFDSWSRLACEYLSDPDESCLPIYSTILETEVIGIACALVVSLTHLIHILARVIFIVIQMKNDDKASQFRIWLYDHGYSTTVALYGVSGTLTTIGFLMMAWAYNFITSFGSRQSFESAIWAAHSNAGFDMLTLLLLSVPIWIMANTSSMYQHRRPLHNKTAATYDVIIAAALITASIRCYSHIGDLEGVCEGFSECIWIWETIRPGQLAAIVLASLAGLIHLSLCLNRLHYVLQWATDRNRINALDKLREHSWTDEQISSVFRTRTTGHKVRQYIASTLCRIQEEEVETLDKEPSKGLLFLRNLIKIVRQVLSPGALDVEHIVLLHDALYEQNENDDVAGCQGT